MISVEGELTVLDRHGGTPLWSCRAHTHGGASTDWHPALAVIATGGHDGAARLWNAADGTLLHTLEAGSTWVERVAFSPD
ncbi:MAG: WD40 repeat domain-containing protein, partial [Verrucomicrobiota bacterium]